MDVPRSSRRMGLEWFREIGAASAPALFQTKINNIDNMRQSVSGSVGQAPRDFVKLNQIRLVFADRRGLECLVWPE